MVIGIIGKTQGVKSVSNPTPNEIKNTISKDLFAKSCVSPIEFAIAIVSVFVSVATNGSVTAVSVAVSTTISSGTAVMLGLPLTSKVHITSSGGIHEPFSHN